MVLPDVMVGMIEHRPPAAVKPVHPQTLIDHRRCIPAHLAGADRVKDRCGDVAGGARKVFIDLNIGPGLNSSGVNGFERRAAMIRRVSLMRVCRNLPVGRRRQIVRRDHRR